MARDFLPNWKIVATADRHVNSSTTVTHPLLIHGNQGIGKSALISYLFLHYRQHNPSRLVVAHFTSASDRSTLYVDVIRRIVVAVKNHFNIDQHIPQDKDDLVKEFESWLIIADKHGGMLLFIDGLDNLDNVDGCLVGGYMHSCAKQDHVLRV